MPGTAADVVAYDALHQPLSPCSSTTSRDARGPRPSSARAASTWRRSPPPPSARPTSSGRCAAVAGALARQQEARGAPRAAERARALAEPGATAIVTGQQAGLFGGPLFVLWKALATIRVARQLEAQRGRAVVPVFWVASDDHDFAEIRSTSLIDSGGADPHPALRPAPRARRPAGLGDPARRHDHRARRGARPGPAARPGPRRGPRGGGGVLPARRDALGGVRAPRVPPAARAGGARPERRGAEAPDGPGDGARASRGLAHARASPSRPAARSSPRATTSRCRCAPAS